MSVFCRARLALLLLPLLSSLALAQAPKAQLSAARLANADEIRQSFGLVPEYRDVRADRIKVAVLDYGFDGAGGQRPYLPADTVIVEHYDPDFIRRFRLGEPDFKKPFTPMNNHGRIMAQIVWAVTGSSPRGPQFYLLNAGGPTLFRRAVRYAIEQKVDVILFSGHFEGAGNYDGQGPINQAVDEAVAAGIIWVNAAGNDGGHVYNGPVREGEDGWLHLTTGRDPTALRFRNLLDENSITVTLTWNDYRDEEDAGTTKDLDLYVEDSAGRDIGSSTLRQVTGDRKAETGETRNPRERVVLADLPASSDQEYRIRIKRHAGQFGPSDRLRVLVASSRNVPVPVGKSRRTAGPVQLLDASRGGEIYPPADHHGAITVGTTGGSSSVGPTTDGRTKPDVYLEEPRARFTNGEEAGGSSVAAAYFAGVVAMMKAAQPRLQASHILTLARLPAGKIAPTSWRANAAANTSPAVRGPEPLPLSFNAERALRHAEASLNQRQAAGLPPGGVYVTLSLPDGRTIRLSAEEAMRFRDESVLLMGRGKPAVPVGPVSADAQRQVPTWRTPSRRLLDELAD